MSNESPLQLIEKLLSTLLLDSTSDFLVSMKIKPTNNIKIYIDSDNGMSIEQCVRYNRKLYHLIEEAGYFPDGNFSLEVSSPGVEEPLKLHRQYVKNVGRHLNVTFADDTEKVGKLLQVTESDIILETTSGKGKKVESHQHIIPIENIKSAVVQIQF